ncbi:hypothetical protein SAMN05216567_103636 [Variovorax sp. OK605]|jgi:hypothetical protein|uniref:hypothetical protein n=1 Tax=unclassified Variovorax TaxID=663243 RepID=UPI0008C2E35B|nr:MULTISPECIES: hypothetical protein [unclassified Variovorax]SEI90171.1 hypothetical protein SAMN05518853_10129 [Variovorax sp. OK202]SFB83036.1 hypothetical protein SAMN05444746_10129 [Variovorax sp. OK212]SFO99444.1 hypothetical protein SAMN05216567_103636 [Variovorax sp. OK605]
MDTDLGPECNPLLPAGWTFELRMSRDAAGEFSGAGLLRRRGQNMCHLTLPGLRKDRAGALKAVKLRVESWLAEWQSR